MKRTGRVGRGIALCTMLASGCESPQSMLDPAGPAAASIAELWWIMFALGLGVTVASLALLAYAAFRRHPDPTPASTETDRAPTFWILVGGVAVPLVILLIIFAFTLRAMGPMLERPGDDALTIRVTGRQWWWDVRYLSPDSAWIARTANEIHIPVGQRVELVLEASDVIHSFWVPELHGKMDLVPGRENRIWIQADEPGSYRGQCAEFCGLQHARMAFTVVAHEPAEFEQWIAGQRAAAAPPSTELERQGQEIFLTRGCVLCHTIRGTPARGQVGPDLTHLASRLTLAAGALPNTRGHLGGWLSNPQLIKPGTQMPWIPLEPLELQAVVAYLERLE